MIQHKRRRMIQWSMFESKQVQNIDMADETKVHEKQTSSASAVPGNHFVNSHYFEDKIYTLYDNLI